MTGENGVPAGAVEGHAMAGADLLGFGNVACRHRRRQQTQQIGLQPEEQQPVAEVIGPGFGIGRDDAGFGGILQEVAVLVAVGRQYDVGHDVISSLAK